MWAEQGGWPPGPYLEVAAGAVIDRRGRLLLGQRPADKAWAGWWELPGGKIEFGETAIEAVAREVREETGCEIEVIGLIDVVDRIDPGSHYVLADYAARWISGEPRPGDDADRARFFAPDALEPLDLWSETVRVIAQARRILHESVRDGSGSRR